MRFPALLCSFLLTSASGVFAQSARHYAIILDDPPVAQRFTTRDCLLSDVAVLYRRQVQDHQKQLQAVLAGKRIGVTGNSDTLLNAIFVTASADSAEELRGLPGVKAVVALRHGRRFTNKA